MEKFDEFEKWLNKFLIVAFLLFSMILGFSYLLYKEGVYRSAKIQCVNDRDIFLHATRFYSCKEWRN